MKLVLGLAVRRRSRWWVARKSSRRDLGRVCADCIAVALGYGVYTSVLIQGSVGGGIATYVLTLLRLR